MKEGVVGGYFVKGCHERGFCEGGCCEGVP